MTAAQVAAELHTLIMEHSLSVGDVGLGQAVEVSEFPTTGEIELSFLDGSRFTVRIQGAL